MISICILAAAARWPGFELNLARIAIDSGRDFEHLELARNVARLAPFAVLVLTCAGLAISMKSQRLRTAETGARAFILLTTFALGPGLLVNGFLKSHSHRPRPIQTMEVSGVGQDFRPFYAFDGGCVRNCSFSSGEAAAAFWTVTPALLAPPGLQFPAVAAAMIFGSATGALRMLAGAHFVSDIAFSALAMIVLAYVMIRLVLRLSASDSTAAGQRQSD